MPTNSLALLPNAMAGRYSRGRGISIHRPPDDEYQLNIYESSCLFAEIFYDVCLYDVGKIGFGSSLVPSYVPTDLSRNVFEVGFEAFSRGSTYAADEI